MTRRTRWILILLVAAAVVLAVAGRPLGRALARALVDTDSAEPADAVVTLSGGARERRATAIQLVRMGLASRLLVRGVKESDLAMEREGLPAGASLEVLPPSAETGWLGGTYEEIADLLDVLRRRGFHRVLLVTSPTHTRRVRYVLERLHRDGDPEVRLLASSSLYFDLDSWWRSRDGRVAVLSEWVKLLAYHVRYR